MSSLDTACVHSLSSSKTSWIGCSSSPLSAFPGTVHFHAKILKINTSIKNFDRVFFSGFEKVSSVKKCYKKFRWFMLTTIYHELYQIKCWRHLEKQFHYPRGFPRWPSFKYSGGNFVFLFSQALEFQSTQ